MFSLRANAPFLGILARKVSFVIKQEAGQCLHQIPQPQEDELLINAIQWGKDMQDHYVAQRPAAIPLPRRVNWVSPEPSPPRQVAQEGRSLAYRVRSNWIKRY